MTWIPRTPEPELMDDRNEVRAYREADFSEVNRELAQRIVALAGAAGRAVDLGTGPASIPLELCRLAPDWRVVALDAGPRMLREGKRLARAAGLERSMRFVRGDAATTGLAGGSFDLVLSNSLLHHLPEPLGFWREVRRLVRRGGTMVIQDLFRPSSVSQAERLVKRHAADAPELLRELFYRSLLAAYRPGEIEEQLRLSGVRDLEVETVSDRHVLVCGRKGG